MATGFNKLCFSQSRSVHPAMQENATTLLTGRRKFIGLPQAPKITNICRGEADIVNTTKGSKPSSCESTTEKYVTDDDEIPVTSQSSQEHPFDEKEARLKRLFKWLKE